MSGTNRSADSSRTIPNEEGLELDAPEAEQRAASYNEHAEEALLGAAMLSSKALEIFATVVRPEDFYLPRLRRIAEALATCFREGLPTDPVSVAAELERTGHLEAAGGPAGLLLNTPATSSAARYAQIVHDHATLRRLRSTAGRIEDLSLGGDAHEAVVRAQALLEEVSSQNGNRSYSSLEIADVGLLLEGDLEPEEATILTRTDGLALFYPGKMHMIQAEPSSGKTWLALLACLEVIALGGSAVYLDAEDTAKGILGRAMALGGNASELRERFQYANPNGAIGAPERTILEQILRRLNPDLVVIDGVAEFLTREGLSEDSASDVTGWMDRLPRWISRTGAAVVMLDHVVKDREQQGRYARGSGAKLAVIDGAAYSVKTISSFSRKQSGSLRLVVAKDKPGGVGPIGSTAAMVSIEPHADGARVMMKTEPDHAIVHVADAFRPTTLMARVSKEVSETPTPLTARALRSLIPASKPKFVSEAIARLVVEGYLREQKVGTATVLLEVKPFIEGTSSDDEPPLEDRTDLAEPVELELEPGRSDFTEEF